MGDKKLEGRGVSIHAPVVGATWFRCLRFCIHHAFQSTLPWWERLSIFLLSILGLRGFNPRSRGGSDIDS